MRLERLGVTFVVLLALAAVVACASVSATGPDLVAVTAPAQRLELPGLSVLPPKGANWFIAPRVSGVPGVPAVNVAAFVKKLEENARASGAVVYARVNVWDFRPWRLDSSETFLRFVREDLQRGTPRQRVIALEVNPTELSGASSCARYRRTAELRGAPGMPDTTFLLATVGVWCLHPQWPQYGIDVVYGQRYRQGLQALPVEAEVEPFLSGVVFTSDRPME